MKTKLLTLFLAIVANMGNMFAESGTCGENLTWDLSDSVLTISGTGDMTNFNIDEVPWYDLRSTITEVLMEDGVTNIGNFAFRYCSSLSRIEIPNSVTSIGQMAFLECIGLTSIDIPNSVTNIGVEAFFYCTGLTSIDIPNSVTSIGEGAFFYCTGLTSIEIPNSISIIEGSTFARCSALTSIVIPNSVDSIGKYAFLDCSSLTSIFNYATMPQTTPPTFYNFGGPPFEGVDKSKCILYVPKESIELYKATDPWTRFTNVLPLAADEAEVTATTVITTDSTANVAWPEVENAYTYELIIRDNNGNIICSLVFDATGRLLSITFHAPSKDHAPQQTQTAGFAFTVNGLTSGTTYTYELTAKDSGGNIINTESGTFTTKGDAPTAIDQITNDQSPMTNKIIKDNQLLILRGDKTYTVTGQEVK